MPQLETPVPVGPAIRAMTGERVVIFDFAAVRWHAGKQVLIAHPQDSVLGLSRNGQTLLVEFQPAGAMRVAACLLSTSHAPDELSLRT